MMYSTSATLRPLNVVPGRSVNAAGPMRAAPRSVASSIAWYVRLTVDHVSGPTQTVPSSWTRHEADVGARSVPSAAAALDADRVQRSRKAFVTPASALVES